MHYARLNNKILQILFVPVVCLQNINITNVVGLEKGAAISHLRFSAGKLSQQIPIPTYLSPIKKAKVFSLRTAHSA